LSTTPQNTGLLYPHQRPAPWHGYLWGIATPLLCTLIDWPLRHVIGPASILMIYLLGVFLVASRYGRGASITASIISAAVFAFYYAYPIFSFAINDLENIIGLSVMIVVASVTSNFVEGLRLQAQIATQREQRADALYRLSQALSDTQTPIEVAKIAVQHIFDDFAAKSVLLFPNQQQQLRYPSDVDLSVSLRQVNLKIAQQSLNQALTIQDGETAIYYPLEPSQFCQAVLVIEAINELTNPDVVTFLDTFRNLITQTLERQHLSAQANSARLQAETESMRNALLSAISHDLRTPLTRIITASTTLIENNSDFSSDDQLDVHKVILNEAQRMSELSSKILDMARLSTGEIVLHQDWNAIEEIVGSALNRLQRNLGNRPVRTLLPDHLPLLWIDAVLVEQVFSNLIENAIKYTPSGSPIDISAELLSDSVKINVADYGLGIPEGMEERLFDKFYRFQPESHESGVGIGLTLCRTIIEAHGGSIYATNSQGRGAVFIIKLPCHEPPQLHWQESLEQ
jgi:two-component system sensor histidine kinase KdpD